MLGPNHDGAQRGKMRIPRAAVINRNAVETRRAKRLHIGSHFFQMTPKADLTSVDTRHQLKSRRRNPAGLAFGMHGQCVERLNAKTPLKRLMKHAPSLQAIEGFD